MAELKTFLFTDIVGSVELKRAMPGRSDSERDQAFIEQILTPHRERIERQLAESGGRVVSTAGDGHFLVFSDTVLAARWAVEIQQSHRDEPIDTPGGRRVEVRISMHLGIPQIDPRDPDNFVGKPVDYAARLNDYAAGGQILVSRSVVAVLEDAGMDGVSFHSHGRRELKGLGRVDIHELIYDRRSPHPMRDQPRESLSRQWTVLPATMGLTEFRAAGGGRAGSQSSTLPGATAPTRLGNYELQQRLGSGGMGDVYRARHSQFGRLRAVKIIKQHFVESGQREIIRRFYQEIKAVGALEHPNIVVAIDSSTPTDAVHYLVMEYIDGVGADELVARQGPLAPADVCEIGRQAARGLAYIHQHGMVHRDIKPSNLMLTVVRTGELSGGGTSPGEPGDEQAVVKILDLGLALLVGDDQQRLTLLDNRAMGTAMYMSPEQWRTTSVDIRADIYSLGCTLYHLLAGKPPYWESDLRPEKAHEREPLPAIRPDRAPPPAVWEVLSRMTAKNPEERFSDPAEVVAALAPLAEGHDLKGLVRRATGRDPTQTRTFAKTDTMVARSVDSDTREATPPGGWGLPKSFPPAARRTARRLAAVAGLLLAVVAIGWLAVQATGRRESVEEARRERQHILQLAADYATSDVLREINIRFAILSRLAEDAVLRQRMVEIDRAPGASSEALWPPLSEWLKARNLENLSRAPAESWFITDRHGRQIARSPISDKSIGSVYAHRDYFHGGGADLPEGTEGLEPIASQHLSAVYRSTSDGTLRVAFSVPIENGRSGAERKVVGVLAMSVDLGEFDVLEARLPPEREVVLIDLRPQTIEGESRRGLVLHHHAREAFRLGDPAPWAGEELLGLIDARLATSEPTTETGLMLPEYEDEIVTGGRAYWGALKTVVDSRRDHELQNTGWAVLVQEPVAR